MLTVKRVKLAIHILPGPFKIQACVALGINLSSKFFSFLKCHQDYYDTKTVDEALPKACSYGHAGNGGSHFLKSLGLFTGMPIVGDTDIVHKYLQADKQTTSFPDAVVTHLEVTDLGQLLGKLYNYRALKFIVILALSFTHSERKAASL